MDKQEILGILLLSNAVCFWIIGGISFTKILLEKQESGFNIICSWLPVLNIIPTANIMEISIWELVKNVFFIVIPIFIIEVIFIVIAGYLHSTLIMSITTFIGTFVAGSIPYYYIWKQIAEKGSHSNSTTLGILSVLPITQVFAIPYIAWKGYWQ